MQPGPQIRDPGAEKALADGMRQHARWQQIRIATKDRRTGLRMGRPGKRLAKVPGGEDIIGHGRIMQRLERGHAKDRAATRHSAQNLGHRAVRQQEFVNVDVQQPVFAGVAVAGLCVHRLTLLMPVGSMAVLPLPMVQIAGDGFDPGNGPNGRQGRVCGIIEV